MPAVSPADVRLDGAHGKVSDAIKVVVRVRPHRPEMGESSSRWTYDATSIDDSEDKREEYAFPAVYQPDDSTERIYEENVKKLIPDVLAGFNSTVFAYGQTGSGKTHTMLGTDDAPGLMTHAIDELFEQMAATEDRAFFVRASYVEIYKEDIVDLLVSKAADVVPLRIIDGKKGPYIPKVKEPFVTENVKAKSLVSFGQKNRHVGATKMNVNSSRSHTVYRLHIESRPVPEGETGGVKLEKERPAFLNTKERKTPGTVRESFLSFVDLAGSERLSKTEATGNRAKEGALINKSLLTLGLIINILSKNEDGKSAHIPYRDSNLTFLLKPALGGNAKCVNVCCVHVADQHSEETHSTLRFASRAKQIVNRVKQNEKESPQVEIARLRKEAEELRAQLAQKDAGKSVLGGVTKAVMQKVVKVVKIPDKDLQKREAELTELAGKAEVELENLRMETEQLKLKIAMEEDSKDVSKRKLVKKLEEQKKALIRARFGEAVKANVPANLKPRAAEPTYSNTHDWDDGGVHSVEEGGGCLRSCLCLGPSKMQGTFNAFGPLPRTDLFVSHVLSGEVRYSILGDSAVRKLASQERPDYGVVFIHGSSTPKEIWAAAQDALALQGIPSFAYDLPGRGFSEMRDDKPQTLEFFVEHLEEMLKLVSFRPKSVCLVGHALGGAIAASYAEKHAEQVSKVMLVAPISAPIKPPSLMRFHKTSIGGWLMRTRVRGWLLGSFKRNWRASNRSSRTDLQRFTAWERFFEHEIEHNDQNLAAGLHSTFSNFLGLGVKQDHGELGRLYGQLGEQLSSGTCAVCLVSGKADVTLPPASMANLHTTHFDGRSTHVQMDAGHFLMLEKELDFVKELVGFAGAAALKGEGESAPVPEDVARGVAASAVERSATRATLQPVRLGALPPPLPPPAAALARTATPRPSDAPPPGAPSEAGPEDDPPARELGAIAEGAPDPSGE